MKDKCRKGMGRRKVKDKNGMEKMARCGNKSVERKKSLGKERNEMEKIGKEMNVKKIVKGKCTPENEWTENGERKA